jgi:hypothetical protein
VIVGSALEAPTVVAGLDDVAVVGQAILAMLASSTSVVLPEGDIRLRCNIIR